MLLTSTSCSHQFDVVSKDNPPRVGQILASAATRSSVIINYMRSYAMAIGFTQEMMNDNNDKAGSPSRVRIFCSHSGQPAPSKKVADTGKQRERTGKRVGCPYSITIWRSSKRFGDPTCQAARDDSLAWVATQVKGLEHGPCPLLKDKGCHELHPQRQDLVPDRPLPPRTSPT